jgi:hypothetical protein
LGIVGEGLTKTNVYIGANYPADLFAWSEAWGAESFPFGPMGMPTTSKAGPLLKGLSIYGNRTAPAVQNAIMFYDRVDGVVVEDVSVSYITGRCMQSGMMKNQVQAYMRESFISKFGCMFAGAPGVSAVEFSSEGNGDTTNEISISDVNIYATYGDSFVLKNNSSGGLRSFRINKLRIEGQQSADPGVDLLRIGDPVMGGTSTSLSC